MDKVHNAGSMQGVMTRLFLIIQKTLFDLEHLIPVTKKRIHASRIEMLAFAVNQQLYGLLDRPGFLVGPLRGQRVEHIRHCHDAPKQGNGLAH